MEIAFPQARQIAQAHIAGSRHDLVIADARTREYEFGWSFAYGPRRFIETGNPAFAVPGLGPLVVTRDGKVETLATDAPPAVKIEQFRQRWLSEHAGSPEVRPDERPLTH